MIFLYIVIAFASLPYGLKDIHVVIGNQAYPNKVLTITDSDIICPNIKIPTLGRISAENLKNALYTIQESWKGGVVFKTYDGLRSFGHYDTIKFKSSTLNSIPETTLLLIKEGTKYPRTFQIVFQKKCLDAIESPNKGKIYLHFNKCTNIDTQIWGAFTEDQVRHYLGLESASKDRDEENLYKILDIIDKGSLDLLNN